MLAALLTNPIVDKGSGGPWWEGEWIDPNVVYGGEQRAIDQIEAEGDAIKAELPLTRKEVKWIGARLETLTWAVKQASVKTMPKVRARIKAHHVKLVDLQDRAIQRMHRDDEEFITMMRLL